MNITFNIINSLLSKILRKVLKIPKIHVYTAETVLLIKKNFQIKSIDNYIIKNNVYNL
jgi:hypothetical protein